MKIPRSQCGLCQCLIFPKEEEVHESQFGVTCVLCYRALEIYGKVWA
jgi:hypothetical protein